ncbi:MAG TPA: hypothetical protein VE569_01690, partial [Acidimicrobiia bacterium]|nr:hypothetical protein [Acidimicrobiia bacterium]
MSASLIVDVSDLVGHPERRREFVGRNPVSLRLGDTVIDGPMQVEGEVKGAIDGVLARFTVSAEGHFVCARCLIAWDETVDATGSQYFGKTPDEDGYAIEDRSIDVAGPAIDELALAMPAAP